MFLAAMTLLFSMLVFPALAANKPPEKGEVLPVMNLPTPKNPDERNYLGLSGSGLFKIPQIKAKAVIVEIFSMYCPYCQKDAPGVNELYRLIENNADIKNKIKLIFAIRKPFLNRLCLQKAGLAFVSRQPVRIGDFLARTAATNHHVHFRRRNVKYFRKKAALFRGPYD